jgi:hypothetical protein
MSASLRFRTRQGPKMKSARLARAGLPFEVPETLLWRTAEGGKVRHILAAARR